ncbi:HIRAN domain-containing protein [Prevotella sp.]|uniref:HIRAN domain-containing protein n=1 Tax=Prevotella sp. TaxID=59823 RepID=UPI00264824B3|nr:HIRAN domain-containing protein [Prevotella sp.]MDN5553191.1 HIRAN domain-containing protein [Prevotella sp.]
MGFLKKLFGGFNDNETSPETTASINDYWRNFFGIDLKSSPNSDWEEREIEYNYSGQLIRNFRLYDLPDSYFTEISVKVIGKEGTNFFFTCPYSYDDSFDIYYIIERDLIHHGNLINTYAGKIFRDKFQSGCKMINWNKIDGCSIMMDRDEDSGDIKLTVWTDFYNEEFLDAENDAEESEDKILTETQTSISKRNTGKMYYNMSYLIDPVNIEYRNNSIMNTNMNLNIVGMQYRDKYKELLRKIDKGTVIVLKPEPDNPYDHDALAFYLEDGTLLGYLSRKDKPFAKIFLANGFIKGTISKIEDKWIDTELPLTQDMIDQTAFAEGNVKVSRIISYGYMNQTSQLVDITELFEEVESNDTVVSQVNMPSTDPKLEEYYKHARQAGEDGDWDEAKKYYRQILPYAPDDWEVNFYLAFTECIKTSINEICLKISNFHVALIRIFVTISDIEDKSERNNILKEVFECSFSIGKQYFNAAMDYFESIDGNDIDDAEEKVFGFNCRLTAEFVHFLGDKIEAVSEGDLSEMAVKAWEEGNIELIKFAKAMFFIDDDEKKKITKTIGEYVDKIRKYSPDAKNLVSNDRFFKVR